MRLENESGDDPYRELARQTLTAYAGVGANAADAEAGLF
jgi:hypothetical protein